MPKMRRLTALIATLSIVVPALVSAQADDSRILGNSFNFWKKMTAGGWDLTRGNSAGAISIPMTTGGPILIQPSTTAMVIIDMQNFFLHESLGGDPKGRDVVPATVNMIHAFRAAGMAVLWTNWGLTDFDLARMPPAFIKGFATDGTSATSFGSDMGTIVVPKNDPSVGATSSTRGQNTTIQVGKKLMRGTWNAQPQVWGPLFEEQVKGVAGGTDFYFNKNRLSGMWGPGTPMQTWLQDNSMTTIFFGGVNVDQCVWGTLLDSYYKGYDVILVDDMSATTSPSSATAMVDYNAAIDGWRANSTAIIPAIQRKN